MDTPRAQISESREPSLRESRATVLLLVVCALYFVVELVVVGRNATDPSDALLDSYWILDATILTSIGALDVTRVWLDHEWWRLFTTSLMHGSWIHLILNLTALASIGPWVEKVWGWRAMLVGFWASAVLGALASCAWVEARFVVGASGGILGLAVILWAARVWGNREIRASLEDILASRLGWMLVAILALGFLVPAIAQAGHIGGFVAGALLVGMSIRPRLRFVFGGTLVALGILLASLGSQPSFRTNYYLYVGFRHLEDDNRVASIEHLEVALRQQPNDPVLQNAIAYQFAELGVELPRAEELVKKALLQDPESADYHDTLGWIRCKQGRVEEGRSEIGKARERLDSPVAEIESHWETCPDVGPR